MADGDYDDAQRFDDDARQHILDDASERPCATRTRGKAQVLVDGHAYGLIFSTLSNTLGLSCPATTDDNSGQPSRTVSHRTG